MYSCGYSKALYSLSEICDISILLLQSLMIYKIKEMQSCFEIITCDTSIYSMDHPDLTVSNVREKSIGLQTV